ncbi:MAG: UDP-3-O-(3-hydroxymyristoyl)glucosamine N-acyltransferase [Acidobacteriota bacterium]
MKTSEIAEFLNGTLTGSGEVEIGSLADINTARPWEISFWEKRDALPKTAAGCVIVPIDFEHPFARPSVRVADAKLAFAKLAEKLHPSEKGTSLNHETAITAKSARVRADYLGAFVTIGESSNIAEGCRIHDGVRIGKNVTVGKFTTIHPNAAIYDNVQIGEGCIIHAGAVIGADGFGFVRDGDRGYVKFPQIGKVVIEDNVEIGANTCIDRGALGETRIGEGTKIDNLVQIAHNVSIGKRVVIAAQTGISGSTVIEDDCVIGGQVGMGDHARVRSGAVIGSQAGILPGKIVRPGIWWGTPVQPLDEYKRQNAHVKGLERLKSQVRELKSDLETLKAQAAIESGTD